MRCVSRQKMKVSKSNHARTLRTLNMNGCLQSRHCHAHVRWIRRNARFACSEDGEHTVAASERRAAGSRLALVAWRCSVAEVHATCSLKKVAGGSREIAKLRRCPGQNRLRE